MKAVVLRVENLVVEYPVDRNQRVYAVSDVTFDLENGEVLGLVGESGCGKSSIGRCIARLIKPTSGRILLADRDLAGSSRRDPTLTPRLQMIFQDSVSSLNPRRTIGDIVEEGLLIWKRGDAESRRTMVRQALEQVGLDPDVMWKRKPHELSGGQCQRVSIARALVLNPDVIVCDEPVSALDVSVQAQIINLLEDLRTSRQLSLVFIAHDLAVVRSISDRVGVMYLGKLCEIGPSDEVCQTPMHPYTEALIAAVPEPDPQVPPTTARLIGELPSPITPPSGCRFHTRCPYSTAVCAQVEPQMVELLPGRYVACHHPT